MCLTHIVKIHTYIDKTSGITDLDFKVIISISAIKVISMSGPSFYITVTLTDT